METTKRANLASKALSAGSSVCGGPYCGQALQGLNAMTTERWRAE